MKNAGSFERELVHVLTWRLFDYQGNGLTYGGVQRWILAFADILNRSGHPVLVHQRAEREFNRSISPGLGVRGHKAATNATGSPWFNARAHRAIEPGAPVLYMSEDLCYPFCRKRSIVVNHGIWWDGGYGWTKLRIAEHIVRHAVKASAATICVDTNFINWLRARYSESCFDDKLHHVTNFIDPGQWGPQPEKPAALSTPGGRIAICFPRRSEPRRGIYLMTEVAPRLAERFADVDFRFVVGSGYHTEALRRRLRATSLSAQRWSLEVLPFERMDEAYRGSAIVVIPTIAGEGTSLAAIEAMYFGCALVTTWVGGLGGMVQDGHNGLLIAPRANDLEAALARLIEDPGLRSSLGENALKVARESYCIEHWRERLAPVLEGALGLRTRMDLQYG